MKHIYINLFFLCLGISSFAQFGGGNLVKATKYYENFSYYKAIEKYTEAQDNAIQSQRNLALSYYKTGETGKAEGLFASLVTRKDKTPEDVFMYASILQQNKKYEESEHWMEVFNSLTSTDSRGISYVNDKGYYKQLGKDKGQFSIKNSKINSDMEDFGPVFYKDKILFASSREGVKPVRRRWNWNGLPFLDIYEAKIIAGNELDSVSLFNKKINRKFHEGPVCFNSRQTKMIITANNYKGKGKDGVLKLKLIISEKINDKWQKTNDFPYNSTEYSVGHASISADDAWMYFASDMPGGLGGVDIYKIELKQNGSFGEPVNLGKKVNTEGDELFPFIHKNGMLFFSSNGRVGLGGLDVFVAQVKDDMSIGKVENLGVPVNSNKDDFSFILDAQMQFGYYASNRSEGHGDDDIYSFNLLKPITFGKTVKGIARDEKGNTLAGVLVELYDTTSKNNTQVKTSDANGSFEFEVEEDKNFELKGTKAKYFDGLNTIDTHTEEVVIAADLELKKDPGLSLYMKVTDKKTDTPLDSVKIAITDNMTGTEEVIYTPLSGDYRKGLTGKKINDRGSYNFVLEKDGYLTKTLTYNTEFDHEGQYDVHLALDFTLDKIEVGEDLSSIIDIKPIYFDLGKSKIKPSAAIELDKIVKVMNENPNMIIELGSHSDSRGSAKFNMLLSDKRAKASATYIKSKITNPERIYGKGYGETILVNECADGIKCSEEKHQQNRRTEFKIIKL